jgi:hypothetical protein
MSTPTYAVFDGDGGANVPKRPVASTDLGGLYKVNDIKYAPNPDTQVTAEDVKQWEMCIERMARMLPVLKFDITLTTSMTGAHPAHVSCVNNAIGTSDVNVSETGYGTYRASWSPSTLPASNGAPMVTVIKTGTPALDVQITSYSATQVNFITLDYTGAAYSSSVGIVVAVY